MGVGSGRVQGRTRRTRCDNCHQFFHEKTTIGRTRIIVRTHDSIESRILCSVECAIAKLKEMTPSRRAK